MKSCSNLVYGVQKSPIHAFFFSGSQVEFNATLQEWPSHRSLREVKIYLHNILDRDTLPITPLYTGGGQVQGLIVVEFSLTKRYIGGH
jgi:hypothetical protein